MVLTFIVLPVLCAAVGTGAKRPADQCIRRRERSVQIGISSQGLASRLESWEAITLRTSVNVLVLVRFFA